VSSRETQAIAALASAKAKALADLERTEAAVFRFSHRFRAFLAAWPDDMPAPTSITPVYKDGEGRNAPGWGADSYVHLTYVGLQGVEVCAARWGTDIIRDPGAEPSWGDYVSTETVFDGMRVLTGCIDLPDKPVGGAQ